MGGLKDQSDEDLMAAYKSGDYAAFECLYTKHSGRIFQYFRSKVSSEAAGDLLQETFLKIHRSRNQYQPQYPFLPWLFTVARNSFIDFMKRSEQKIIQMETDIESIPAQLPSFVAETDLSAALSGLPHIQRRAIELRYLNEWSFEKIASELDTSPENTRKIISRGIKTVRSFFKGEGK